MDAKSPPTSVGGGTSFMRYRRARTDDSSTTGSPRLSTSAEATSPVRSFGGRARLPSALPLPSFYMRGRQVCDDVVAPPQECFPLQVLHEASTGEHTPGGVAPRSGKSVPPDTAAVDDAASDSEMGSSSNRPLPLNLAGGRGTTSDSEKSPTPATSPAFLAGLEQMNIDDAEHVGNQPFRREPRGTKRGRTPTPSGSAESFEDTIKRAVQNLMRGTPTPPGSAESDSDDSGKDWGTKRKRRAWMPSRSEESDSGGALPSALSAKRGRGAASLGDMRTATRDRGVVSDREGPQGLILERPPTPTPPPRLGHSSSSSSLATDVGDARSGSKQRI